MNHETETTYEEMLETYYLIPQDSYIIFNWLADMQSATKTN